MIRMMNMMMMIGFDDDDLFCWTSWICKQLCRGKEMSFTVKENAYIEAIGHSIKMVMMMVMIAMIRAMMAMIAMVRMKMVTWWAPRPPRASSPPPHWMRHKRVTTWTPIFEICSPKTKMLAQFFLHTCVHRKYSSSTLNAPQACKHLITYIWDNIFPSMSPSLNLDLILQMILGNPLWDGWIPRTTLISYDLV